MVKKSVRKVRLQRWLILIIALLVGGCLIGNGDVQASRNAVNQALQQNLTQVRTYANSDPGNYGYAKFIQHLYYCGGNRCLVQASPELRRLHPADRTNVVNQTQALAKMVLVDQGACTSKQVRAGLQLTIKIGRQTVGYSQVNHHYRYHWLCHNKAGKLK